MKTILLTILVLAAIFLGACGNTATPSPQQAPSILTPVPAIQVPASTTAVLGSKAAITISGFKFDPDTVTVKTGTTITWTNQDSTDHTVTADDGSWKSENLAKDATFSFTFDKAGTYTYHCSIHTSMKGTIIVN
jgi:plastocyanin